MQRVLVSWSSGKDSAWMLHVLRQQSDVEVCGLLTTLNGAMDRVAMHAVRRTLLEEQARQTGLPLWTISLPWPCSNAEYESRFAEVLTRAASEGITHIAFGDLFLQDIREYRIRQLAGSGIEPLFPIWCGPDGTRRLAEEMIATRFRALLTCIDPRLVDPAFVGRLFDAELLAQLPGDVDPCGERGEFHTFCWGGPVYRQDLSVRTGEIVTRDGFVFADVLAEEASAPPASLSAAGE